MTGWKKTAEELVSKKTWEETVPWVWKPGMRWILGEKADQEHQPSSGRIDPTTKANPPGWGAIPDLEDPGTAGILLNMLAQHLRVQWDTTEKSAFRIATNKSLQEFEEGADCWGHAIALAITKEGTRSWEIWKRW